MSEITPVGPTTNGPISNNGSLNGHAAVEIKLQDARPSVRLADRVELSDRARFLDQLRGLPEVRREEVDRLKYAISEGLYPSEDKIRVAVDRLMEDLEI